MSKKAIHYLGLVAAAAALIVYLGSTVEERPSHPEEAATELDEDAKDQLAAKAAMSMIAAESRNIDAGAVDESAGPVEAAAPPGFVPAPPTAPEATPPEGYSFTAYHEVARGPMTEADRDREHPPAAPPEWMASGDAVLAELAAAAGRDWSFGWVQLAEGANLDALGALLAAYGGEVLGRAGNLVRARLPGDPASLQAIAAAGSVAGLGAVPAGWKITETLARRTASEIHDQVPVWITLMSDDPGGQWREALKRLGAEVGRFDPAVRTYAATIPLAALGPIAQADYVLAVESVGRVVPTLEIAAPAMGADAVRSYDAGMDAFVGVGGASVPVGIMDTGFNIAHPDLSSNRRSICGVNLTDFFDSREEDQDLWLDFGAHGSHVSGIVFGNGAADRSRAGMAPLVQDIRFAKAVSSYGSASALGWNRAMDWFAKPTSCSDDTARKVLVINSSLGATSDEWRGRSVVERKIDAAVWEARQLFVTSAANAGPSGISSMAGAKNALAVGAAQNIGDISWFSSIGPTRDGRLMPKIVGTGVDVMSTQGNGARNGYLSLSGTSMSSPAVVGVATLVMDAVPEFKEEPAALRARLMASAVKPDAFLGDAAVFPYDNSNGPGTMNNVYGLGKVSARTAVLSRDQEDGWTGGSAAFDVDADSHAYHDIVVPEGASRLDIVMTWDEPPADTITDPVLHDLDLWVDRGASCGDIAACGHYSSRSRVDNAEWVIVPHPPAGLYRLKVLPNRIYGAAPRAGLAWTVIRGDSTPALAVAVDSDRVEIGPDVPFEVDVTISTDAYVAAGANLRVDCRTAVGSTACDGLSYGGRESNVLREDGLERTLARDGTSIVVGEIGPGEERTVQLAFPGQPEGSFRLHLTARGWNATAADTSVAVVVGGAETPAPVQRPPNDDFAMAMELDSAGGETSFDIVAATPDPGEPPDTPFRVHPQRLPSLWYLWTAPETGLARFMVAQSFPGDHADYVVVDVYRDGPMAGLEAVAGGQLGGGVTFFADQGETYRIRLGIHPQNLDGRRSALPDLTLIWGPGSRPANDDYALAGVLEGSSGTTNGTTQGATTEPAELMGHASPTSAFATGGWTGSVWYRWTAPSTGDYRFSVNRVSQVVAAFQGSSLMAARMVSGIPAQGPEDGVVFPAAEGAEYRIGVATGSAYWSGTEFELSWAPGTREPGNDDFANATPLSGDFGAGSVAFNDLTVEPGEPAASGVRTAWWSWQPSEDGRYTWLVNRSAGFVNDEVPLQMAVFAGEELAALEVVAVDEGDDTIELQMAFDARADSAYRLAVGLPRSAAQTPLRSSFLVMQLGPTPGNDDLANAAPLSGMSGSVSGSNRFATNEQGEHTGGLGDSSLWWTFEPEEDGWVRFEVDGPRSSKLAIYRIGDAGELELVRTGRNLGIHTSTVHVEAGARYVIRYGTYYWDADGFGGDSRGDFEISWGPSDAPALLRYVDRVFDGQDGGYGSVVDLAALGNQAFNADGTELYVASTAGIVVFARDPATGKVDLASTLADYPVFDTRSTQMIWDDTGAALLVAGCDEWLKFTAAAGGGIEYAGYISGAPCPSGDILVHGDFVHHVMAPWLIETFRFDEGHSSLDSEGVNMIPDVAHAAMTADGANIYAVTVDDEDDEEENSLVALERDPETGSLRIANILANAGNATALGNASAVQGLANIQGLAVHGSHLFLATGTGATLGFDLADRAKPAFLGSLPSFHGAFGTLRCRHSVARHGIAAVDVACRNEYFTVQAAADGSLFGSDLVRGFRTDSFGNAVPFNDFVLSFAASPDGRHVYMAGVRTTFQFIGGGFQIVDTDQLMIFERVHGD